MRRNGQSISQQRSDYDARNVAAARAILENPERYEGIQLEWARLYAASFQLGKMPAPVKDVQMPARGHLVTVTRCDQGRLFEGTV